MGASKDNFAERLVLFLRNSSVNWNSSIPQPFPPATTTTSFNGYPFAQEVGGNAYTKQGFEIDKEDYGFNGDNLL